MTTPAERYAAAKLRGQHPITTEFLLTFDFEFDPFQVAACHAVEDGKGVLVAAPTGAGKTVVGEFAAYFALQAGKKCFYTCLLYTSPSPRDRQKSRMPSSA